MKKLFLLTVFSYSLVFANSSDKCDNIFLEAASIHSINISDFLYGQNASQINDFIVYQNGYGKYFLENTNGTALLDTRLKIEIKKYNKSNYIFVDFVHNIFANPAIYAVQDNKTIQSICSYKYDVNLKCDDCEDKKMEEYINKEYKNIIQTTNLITVDFNNDGVSEKLEYFDDISGGKCDYSSYIIIDINKNIFDYISDKYEISMSKCHKNIRFFSFNEKNYIYIENFDFSATVYLIEFNQIAKQYKFRPKNILFIRSN